MKEYIKMFNDLQSSNGYIIKDIPFIATASGETPLNVHCNQENKKIEVDGQGNISVVDAGIPSDEIWYTSSDGNIIAPYSANSLPTIISNTYADGKGVIKFASDVTSIGNYAFSGRTSLTSIEIPNSVASIGYYAFRGCSGLTSITIPDSVTNIGGYAFENCTSLTAVTIPNSVTSVGWYAFENCTSLTSIEIPNSVTSIGIGAFENCTSLTAFTIPNSVTSIGSYAFSGCTSLPVVDNLRYADTYLVGAVDETLTSYTIKDGTKWIGSGAFKNCSSLTSVTIPNSVTSIENEAFSGCTSLTSVTIPNSVTSIESNAFTCGRGSYTGSLQTITVGETVFTYEGVRYFTITLGNGEVKQLIMHERVGGGGD